MSIRRYVCILCIFLSSSRKDLDWRKLIMRLNYKYYWFMLIKNKNKDGKRNHKAIFTCHQTVLNKRWFYQIHFFFLYSFTWIVIINFSRIFHRSLKQLVYFVASVCIKQAFKPRNIYINQPRMKWQFIWTNKCFRYNTIKKESQSLLLTISTANNTLS